MCHHYLVPLLSQIPLDASILKRDSGGGGHSSMGPPDQVGGDKAADDATDATKDSSDPLQGDVSDDLYITRQLRNYLCRIL